MKKKLCWLSLLSLVINIAAFGLFARLLAGGLYQSAVWYLWMILSLITPALPLVAKHYRLKGNLSGKPLEIASIIFVIFNFSNVCIYGLNMNKGDLVGWAAMIICALVYSKVID